MVCKLEINLYPLFETVKSLFTCEAIIPSKNGAYVSARCAKIARQERLASLFTDNLLSQLICDGKEYKWLPTYLTETNREYEAVYKYLTSELKINVVRPEELRNYFVANPQFLPKQTDDWLVELYSILENVGAAFAKTKNESNMLTADIIKASTGKFVAAYRKTDNKQYIPNVFLPIDKVIPDDINFVDKNIYDRCRHFFDNILQLQKPNEYEFFIKDVKRRYEENYQFEPERILRLSESEISSGEYVAMDVENQELWFTQTHIAEIKALLQLAEDVKNADTVVPTQSSDDEDKAGLSVYNSYVGKTIKRKDGFSGKVTKVDAEYITVEVTTPSTKGGPQKGDQTKIQLSFVISNTGVYEII